MAGRFNEQRRDFFYSSGKALIMPLLSRWEERDAPDDAKQWLPKVLDTLRPSYDQWRSKDAAVERLVELLKIPYKAKWNFGERLAVLEESATDPGSVSYHLHIIAATLARDFRDTDLLACEPERYVRTAAQEAPRKRLVATAQEVATSKGRRGSSKSGSETAADSDAEIAADVHAFLRAVIARESRISWSNPNRSVDHDTSHADADTLDMELLMNLKLLLPHLSDVEAIQRIDDLKALRSLVGRRAFETLKIAVADVFSVINSLRKFELLPKI